jgi:hypothetical protein
MADENDPTALEEQLTELLRQAGEAHSQGFAHVNSVDPQWPQWYADFLAPQLSSLFGHPIDPLVLAAELEALDIEQRAQAPEADWRQYYSARLVRRYFF